MRGTTAVVVAAMGLLLGNYLLLNGHLYSGFISMAAGWLTAGYFYNDRRR